MPLRTAASALLGLDDTALAEPSTMEYERLRWFDRCRLVHQSGAEITSHGAITVLSWLRSQVALAQRRFQHDSQHKRHHAVAPPDSSSSARRSRWQRLG
jgi:hypothetical protein